VKHFQPYASKDAGMDTAVTGGWAGGGWPKEHFENRGLS